MRTNDVNEYLAGLTLAETDELLVKDPRRRRDYGRKRHSKGNTTLKPFCSWDGEAAGSGIEEQQDYCLIGNSEGGKLVSYDSALHSISILEFMLQESERLKGYIHVAFGFNYDVNHIIRNLPFQCLRRLHQKNVVFYGQYRLEWYPNKWFSVTHRDTERFILIYDTIGFWATSLINAIRSDPKLSSDSRLGRIEQGKSDRGTFQLSELDSKIIPYFQAEMELHRDLMENLRETLIEVDLVPSKWYGPSAMISTVYRKVNLKQNMNRPESDLTRPRKRKNGRIQSPDTRIAYTLPDAVNTVARGSFAGGRFEQFKIGYYEGPIYGYDITSAYPSAMLTLPSLRYGKWDYLDRDGLKQYRGNAETELPWGFYRINYDYLRGRLLTGAKNVYPYSVPHPLFRRDSFGRIAYPYKSEGWYPSHSANALRRANYSADITEGWTFDPRDDVKPFENDTLNFRAMFDQRQEYRDDGREDLAYALKITLNSGYGKTAQRQGVELGDNLPAFHQMEWATHITDHCRIQIWHAAVEAWNNGSLIAIETDAIYTTKPLDIESSGLGGFTCQKYDGICYLQSGVYFTKEGGEWTFHMRGLAKDAISIDTAREHLHSIQDWDAPWPPLFGRTHTFNGIGYSRISDTGPDGFYKKWLKWQNNEREIRLGVPGLKRAHWSKKCEACRNGVSPAKGLHDLFTPQSHAGISYPRKDSWIPENEGVVWQDEDLEKWN